MDVVLEEGVVKVPLETAAKGLARLNPLDAVRELLRGAGYEQSRPRRGEVHLYHPVPVVRDGQAALREYVRVVLGLVDVAVVEALELGRGGGDLAEHAPDGEVVKVELEPVVAGDGVPQRLHGILFEHRQRAQLGVLHVLLELYQVVRVDEIVAFQDFANSACGCRRG